DRSDEARRRAELAETYCRGLDRRDAASADQEVGLQARGRQRRQRELPHAAPDQRPSRRHCDARGLARHCQHAAIDDRRQGFVEGADEHAAASKANRHTLTGAPARLLCRCAISATAYASAPFTRSGENGTRRMRTPVASKMALAMAAAIGRIEGSPAPAGATSGRLISTISIVSGVSVMSRMG